MSEKQGKIWGDTIEILNTPNVEIHRIRGVVGHQCSEHYHRYKRNWFYVISGKLLIRRWKENDMIDETTLKASEQTSVPANEWHQFEVLEDCDALEGYWAETQVIDITRRSQGGRIVE
jgi:quercetin dioxygenase-like cupin family protein|tara:strand:- start:4087 stop:4440 length:354 start_codon:yes stop_codon:yes gene_type:complete